MPAPGMHSGDATDDALNLSMSEHAVPLFEAVKNFIKNEVDPITEEYYRLGEGRAEHWGYGAGQLELLDAVKAKAKANGLWNFFLPNAETGEGLSNLDYAYIANELGKSPLASECLNCSAPDTGNMEVLERVGTAGAEEAVAGAVAQRRDPLGLLDDRAGHRLVGRQEPGLPGPARRRRVGDHRREVLHLRRRRPALQDPDRHAADQPGRAAAPAALADPGPERRARRGDPRPDARVRQRRRAARPHAHPLQRRPRARTRTCCSARAVASRSPRCASAPAASTTACARSAWPRRRWS